MVLWGREGRSPGRPTLATSASTQAPESGPCLRRFLPAGSGRGLGQGPERAVEEEALGEVQEPLASWARMEPPLGEEELFPGCPASGGSDSALETGLGTCGAWPSLLPGRPPRSSQGFGPWVGGAPEEWHPVPRRPAGQAAGGHGQSTDAMEKRMQLLPWSARSCLVAGGW